MKRVQVLDTPICGLRRIVSLPLGDHRGHLTRIFCTEELKEVGWNTPVAQANITLTQRQGTVRGMHFQYPPHCETKLVRCLHGRVWDVVVDIRRGSPTFLQWHAEVLSAGNFTALLIPQGCAHGFQTLTNDAEMLYFHSAVHEPAHEGGVPALDPHLAISWPLPITEMSDRDRTFPHLSSAFEGIELI